MKKSICVTFDRPGFHFYPDAPDEVSFLASPHRHLFNFRCYFTVEHDNRELEFFLISKDIQKFIDDRFDTPAIFGPMSCEMIATQILLKFQDRNCYRVEVWEDKENGSIVEL